MPPSSVCRQGLLRAALIAALLTLVVAVFTFSAAHIHKDVQGEPLGHCSFCMIAAQVAGGITAVGLTLLLSFAPKWIDLTLAESLFVPVRERQVFRVRPPPVF